MLDSAIAALKTPVADSEADKETAAAALDKTNRGLKNSLNNVLTVRAELGTQLNELESLDSLGSDRALGQTQQMSDLVDVDWNATISSYIMQQTALQRRIKHLPICRDCRSSSSTNNFALKTYHETGYVLSACSGIAGAGIFLHET
ncbi:flagellar hook-associated protein 3 [Escherichia coli]|uniref:Flagellar hook-associated protein 3 n=1 Tax=Escherichia coli TaxID=562 RepID=A0A376L7L5_ECOLX|nr:flagellar hook-associated protein 3 [Escherichia coli]